MEGTWVKVEWLCRERFWCRVERVRPDGALVTSAENDLVRSPVRCGDEVVVWPKDVLETANDTDRVQFDLLCFLVGDPREAAMLWREMRAVAQGRSSPPRDGAVFLT